MNENAAMNDMVNEDPAEVMGDGVLGADGNDEEELVEIGPILRRLERLEAMDLSRRAEKLTLGSANKCKPAEPPKFGGKDQDVREWLSSIEHYLWIGDCEEHKRVPMALTFLAPKVANHWRMRAVEMEREGRNIYDWAEFRTEMIAAYGSANPESKAAQKLQRFRQIGTVEEYSRRFLELVAQITTLPMSEGDKIRSFLSGLSSDMQVEMATASRGQPWTNFEMLRTTAVALDNSLRNARSMIKGKGKMEQSFSSKNRFSEASSSKSGGGKRKDFSRPKGGNGKFPNPKKPKAQSSGPKLSAEERQKLFKENKCFLCKKEGHKSVDCPEKGRKSEN